MLSAGNVVQFIYFVVFCAIFYWGYQVVKKGAEVPTKPLPGVDAIEEAIGRATEIGRPFLANIQASGPHLEDQILASCELLRFAAQTAVRYEAPFLTVSNSPDGHPLFEEIVKSSYSVAGKPDMYDPSMVRFIGGFSAGTHVQIMQLIRDEKIAAQLISGNLMNQTMFFAEEGAAQGAIQIGATKNTHQMPFLAIQCDYALMGDDLYAAAAMISRDPLRLGSLIAQESGKVFCLLVIVIGVIMKLTGSSALPELLGK